jgi:hypothetical protein
MFSRLTKGFFSSSAPTLPFQESTYSPKDEPVHETLLQGESHRSQEKGKQNVLLHIDPPSMQIFDAF